MKFQLLFLLILFSNISFAINSVTLDFSISSAESWDRKDDSSNMISNCISGNTITGFEYSNITIQTFGRSFLSEAIIYFSNSNDNDDGVILAVGSGDEYSGTKSYSSQGILDITDNGFSDVVSLADNQFLIQFYETIDDEANSIDAVITSGTLKIWGDNLSLNSSCNFAELPDEYENDDTIFVTTNVIGINGIAQHHNFQDDAEDFIILPSSNDVLSEFGLNSNVSCPNFSCKIELSNQSNVDLCIKLFYPPTFVGPIPEYCQLSNTYLSEELVSSPVFIIFPDTPACSIMYDYMKISNSSSILGVNKKYDVRLVCRNGFGGGGIPGGLLPKSNKY